MQSYSLNDFTVLKTLGSGSFACVYKVQRKLDNSIYALKKVKLNELSLKEKDNALNEVRILASINSPNIIRYKDAFYDNASGSLCIIMEFAENGDLAEKLKTYKRRGMFVEESQIWQYAAEILTGLKCLHDLKIMHRDLKCANIFLAANNQVKLGDLNVSKITKRDLAYTQTGTPYYTSPEVWSNQPYDSKCDIWSMGCVLYELMAQHPPFEGKSMDDLFKRICKGTYQKLPKIYSNEMNEFIGLCLRKAPKTRPCATQLLNCPQLQRFIDSRSRDCDDDKENYQPQQRLYQQNSAGLLNTMKMPLGNMNALKNILPKAQFGDSIDSLMDEHRNGVKRRHSARPTSAQNYKNEQPRNFLEPGCRNRENSCDRGNSPQNQQPACRNRINSAHNENSLSKEDFNYQRQQRVPSNNNNYNNNGGYPVPKCNENKRVFQRNGIEMIRPRAGSFDEQDRINSLDRRPNNIFY